MDYNGEERRSNWVTKKVFQDLTSEVKRLSDKLEHHINLYEDFLKVSLTEKQEKQELRRAMTEKVLTGGIWAIVIFFALASWDYVKTHVK